MKVREILKKMLPGVYVRYKSRTQQTRVQRKINNKEIAGLCNEIRYANVYHDTVLDSPWFKDVSVSPNGSAVGYPFLYVLYRILNECKPRTILEFGSGQSTVMIGKYAESFSASHTVIEACHEWIEFFFERHPVSEHTRIIETGYEYIKFKNADHVRVLADFPEILQNVLGNTSSAARFDFICIDAPLGVDMKKYSRIDVLKLIPNALADSFVLIFDDTDRIMEQNTLVQVRKALSASGIAFCEGSYSGSKELRVICSEDKRYLCSL